MAGDGARFRRKHGQARPLDEPRLEELALAYVARFATSTGKLEAYLRRKLRERGWAGEREPDIAALVARHVANGWIDDAAWGRSKAQGLLARGYGARRVEQTLRGAEIDGGLRAELEPDELARREATLTFARRRGFGPFGARAPGTGSQDGPADGPADGPGDREARRKLNEKRLAAMLRAGHEYGAARRVLDAATIEELEQWVAEARDSAS